MFLWWNCNLRQLHRKFWHNSILHCFLRNHIEPLDTPCSLPPVRVPRHRNCQLCASIWTLSVKLDSCVLSLCAFSARSTVVLSTSSWQFSMPTSLPTLMTGSTINSQAWLLLESEGKGRIGCVKMTISKQIDFSRICIFLSVFWYFILNFLIISLGWT